MQTLQDAGVTFTEVNPDGGFFEELSWEQAGKYDADVILTDAREPAEVDKQAAATPTWANLPAVRAGQVYEWKAGAPYSYQTYAQIFEDVATWLEDVRPVD